MSVLQVKARCGAFWMWMLGVLPPDVANNEYFCFAVTCPAYPQGQSSRSVAGSLDQGQSFVEIIGTKFTTLCQSPKAVPRATRFRNGRRYDYHDRRDAALRTPEKIARSY